jgi:hypothetical protein
MLVTEVQETYNSDAYLKQPVPILHVTNTLFIYLQ